MDIIKKLKITDSTRILIINGPPNYKELIGNLPGKAMITNKRGSSHGFIHLFVKNKKEIEDCIKDIVDILALDGILWISYPKGSSGMQTDLTRDEGWESLEKFKLRWLSLISLDDTWSAFCLKNEVIKKPSPEVTPFQKLSGEYIDSKNRIIHLPPDFELLLTKDKKAKQKFDLISFTERKEMVLWIVSAKRPETRKARITKAMAALKK